MGCDRGSVGVFLGHDWGIIVVLSGYHEGQGPSVGGRGGLRRRHSEEVPRRLALREGHLQVVRELNAPGAAAPARLYSGKRP